MSKKCCERFIVVVFIVACNTVNIVFYRITSP
jgi:hypothetical protein